MESKSNFKKMASNTEIVGESEQLKKELAEKLNSIQGLVAQMKSLDIHPNKSENEYFFLFLKFDFLFLFRKLKEPFNKMLKGSLLELLAGVKVTNSTKTL